MGLSLWAEQDSTELQKVIFMFSSEALAIFPLQAFRNYSDSDTSWGENTASVTELIWFVLRNCMPKRSHSYFILQLKFSFK